MGFAVENHMSVRDMVLTAVKKRGDALDYAAPALKADKDVVSAAIEKSGNAWIFASDSMKTDKDILFKAFKKQGMPVDQNMISKDLMMAKCCEGLNGFSFQYAADSFKSDKGFVRGLVSKFGETLEFANHQLKADKDVVYAAVTSRKQAFDYVDKTADMWADKSFVMQMVQWDGKTLEYAAGFLKTDRDVVLAAVRQNGAALKFAGGGLNQNPECLRVAGLWEDEEDTRPLQAIQSVKFSLTAKSSTYATDFALAAKKDPYLKTFRMYNPNAFCKHACDPHVTNMYYPCLGSMSRCTGSPDNKRNFRPDPKEEGKVKPCATSCWRYSFRWHQEQCKANNGFMIQVMETSGLGGGQQIETAMAEEIGIKVFRTYTNYGDFENDRIEKLSKRIQEWHEKDEKANMDLLEYIYIGKDSKTPNIPSEL